MSRALQFLILTTAGWRNRQQEDAIEYLKEENRVLREILSQKRIRFSDAQRRRLAMRGKKLGRKVLAGLAGIATPDTILR
ncbi:MAG: putative transposase [Verrucomicrobiales bacterium]|jgi:putative transposase